MRGQADPYPQEQATAAKPKLTLIEVIRSARTPEEMLPLVAAAFPNTAIGELAAAIEAELNGHAVRCTVKPQIRKVKR